MEKSLFNQKQEAEKIINHYHKNPKKSNYTEVEIKALSQLFGIGYVALNDKNEVGKRMGYTKTRTNRMFETIERKMEWETNGVHFHEMMVNDSHNEKSIMEMVDLRWRTRNALWKNGITTVGRFKRYLAGNYRSGLNLRSVGTASKKEIEELMEPFEKIEA